MRGVSIFLILCLPLFAGWQSESPQRLAAAVAAANAGGGGGWEPSDLGAALYQFYDPDQHPTNDLSGNGFHLTAGGSGYASGRTINGKSVWDFDGAGYLENSAIAGYGNLGDDWVFAGVAYVDIVNSAIDSVLSVDASVDFQFNAGTSISDDLFGAEIRSSGLGMSGFSGGNDHTAKTFVYLLIFDGAAGTCTIRINGVQDSQVTNYSGGFQASGYSFRVFANRAANNFPDGAHGPAIVASTVDSGALANIEQWLADSAGVILP